MNSNVNIVAASSKRHWFKVAQDQRDLRSLVEYFEEDNRRREERGLPLHGGAECAYAMFDLNYAIN